MLNEITPNNLEVQDTYDLTRDGQGDQESLAVLGCDIGAQPEAKPAPANDTSHRLPEYEELYELAGKANNDNYSTLLDQVAVHSIAGNMDDVKTGNILRAMQKSMGVGLMELKRTLKERKDITKRLERAEQWQQGLEGSYGMYAFMGNSVKCRRLTEDGYSSYEMPICGSLSVSAEAYDSSDGNRGLLLEWSNTQGATKQWLMPVELLAGDGLPAIKSLMAGGLYINTGADKYVVDYINTASQHTKQRLTCTDKTGWLEGNFITPDKTYGAQADNIMFQSKHEIQTGYSQRGSLQEWQIQIAEKAQGNHRLMLALSSAFAGSLLQPAEVPGFGVHFHGGSSTGKTTLLAAAGSVWGRPKRDGNGQGGYMRQWLTTAVGVEGMAFAHNDGLLVLDEIGEATARTVSNTAYMLANGITKVRGNRDGSTKAPKYFRVVFLSSGELTLDQMMKSEGRTTRAGQEIRLVNVQADAGQGLGIFDQVMDFEGGAELSEHLNEATAQQYGTAGKAWLTAITEPDGIPSDISRAVCVIRDELLEQYPGASGQVQRVARQFALIAYAGELATRHGITGWSEGEATAAAKVCFNSWLEDFGSHSGQREATQIIEKVKSFLIHSEYKFQDLDIKGNPDPVPDRVGWRQRINGRDGGKEYTVPASELHRLANGYSQKQIVQALFEAGALNEPDSKGRTAIQKKIDGRNQRVYIINLDKPEAEAPCPF